jgi:formylglycine-generating enzyme required for sulfatase activity
VTITRPFWIGVHEVTLGQFRAFVADTGYQTEAERDGRGAAGRAGGKWETRPEYSWRHVGYERPDDEPVVNVTWDDAAAFCEWLSKKEGQRYRLPTETEWEYAARAGTETPFYWGEDEGRMDRYVWHAGNSRGGPHAVGRREPNAFGLHDACGNVYEYCLDRYAPRPYAAGPAVDPFVPPAGDLRVVRGGSWGTLGIHCRSAFRGSVTLGHRNQRDGFRVVREE